MGEEEIYKQIKNMLHLEDSSNEEVDESVDYLMGEYYIIFNEDYIKVLLYKYYGDFINDVYPIIEQIIEENKKEQTDFGISFNKLVTSAKNTKQALIDKILMGINLDKLKENGDNPYNSELLMLIEKSKKNMFEAFDYEDSLKAKHRLNKYEYGELYWNKFICDYIDKMNNLQEKLLKYGEDTQIFVDVLDSKYMIEKLNNKKIK